MELQRSRGLTALKVRPPATARWACPALTRAKVVEIGPPEHVISNPNDERTRTFRARFLHG